MKKKLDKVVERKQINKQQQKQPKDKQLFFDARFLVTTSQLQCTLTIRQLFAYPLPQYNDFFRNYLVRL